MQSPKHQEYYHKDKERKQENESPTTTTTIREQEEEEEKGEIIDSTTLLAVKNKKRVHYPQANGEQPTIDSVKTDNLKQNNDKSSSGIEKKTKSFE